MHITIDAYKQDAPNNERLRCILKLNVQTYRLKMPSTYVTQSSADG